MKYNNFLTKQEKHTMKEFIDFIKSIATTAIALAVVLAAGYNFVDEQLNEKIRLVSSSVVQETFTMIKVEDAVFQLEKENDKYVRGEYNLIRKQNLEVILKYQDEIIEQYPSKRAKLRWAASYYDNKFVVNSTASGIYTASKKEKRKNQDETSDEIITDIAAA